LIEKIELKNGKSRTKQRKMSLARSSFNSQGANIAEHINPNDFNEFLKDYNTKTEKGYRKISNIAYNFNENDNL